MNTPKTIKEIVKNSPLLNQLQTEPDLEVIYKKKKKELRRRRGAARQLLKNETWKPPVTHYIKIPNMFFDAMYKYSPDVQAQLIAYIIRHTWGWRAGGGNRRKWVNVRLKTLVEKLKRPRDSIYKARGQLEKKGFIIRKGNYYRINEHYPGWKKTL